jgi:Cys-tRNA synthase (O-phospho-L-seryl-tRNA:Cys-tRNA synthase)
MSFFTENKIVSYEQNPVKVFIINNMENRTFSSVKREQYTILDAIEKGGQRASLVDSIDETLFPIRSKTFSDLIRRIKDLSGSHIAVITDDYTESREGRILFECAKEYNVPILKFTDGQLVFSFINTNDMGKEKQNVG